MVFHPASLEGDKPPKVRTSQSQPDVVDHVAADLAQEFKLSFSNELSSLSQNCCADKMGEGNRAERACYQCHH